MDYTVEVQGISPNTSKVVWWECGDDSGPSLAEVIKAAQKEFPGIPFEKLETTSGGYEGHFFHRLAEIR